MRFFKNIDLKLKNYKKLNFLFIYNLKIWFNAS